MAERVVVKSSGAVVEVMLNRPERRNALDAALLTELLDKLSGVVALPECPCRGPPRRRAGILLRCRSRDDGRPAP